MKNDRITFEQLEHVLEDLGFQKKVLETSHVRYENLTSGTVFLVRPHQPSDFVPDYLMASVRTHLSYHGVIEPDALEAMLQDVAA